MTDDELPPLVRSLLAAVAASPADVALRLHVADLLLQHDLPAQAALQCAEVLSHSPGDVEALRMLQRATDALRGVDPSSGFDWSAAEAEVGDLVAPAFAVGGEADLEAFDPGAPMADNPDVITSDVRLDDVGGMAEVKRRIEMSFLNPMHNPELRALYGRSLNGGLLLYGPPGCGKTFMARAIAGEIGARFYSVSLADVLDVWLGASERNLREIFEVARAHAPCVLFLDEIDAIGQKRSHLRSNPAMRGTVNQLLSEMDSVRANNQGVFVLGATNHPWDVDAALLRPGRLDRMVLVAPPDEEARRSILAYHLRDRPIEGIDLDALAARTEHLSGADLAHLCDSAAELAMDDSVRSGTVRRMMMRDFKVALKEVRPSTRAWLEDARNVVLFANQDGLYDDLLDYLKKRKMT